MFSESSLTCGLRSDEDDVKTGCKNVKLFFVEPLALLRLGSYSDSALKIQT